MEYRKTIQTKDGRRCLLRSAHVDDAVTVLDAFQQTHAETDNLLFYPDENSFTLKEERKFLLERARDPKSVEILALLDGKLAGFAGIGPIGRGEKLRFRADFGISILKAYWGLGIGRALTNACIDCARAAGYRQVELEVVA
jgi:GNAT superfamily N-acetyltransferase